MRDGQVATFLQTHPGFVRGVISSEKPMDCVSLSEILQSEASAKYFLSPTACRGILRRAAKRGKELPTMLHSALERAAEVSSEPEKPEDKTQS